MNARLAALSVAALAAFASVSAAPLPIYIEDNHAGSFYWLAQHVDLAGKYTLIHFDAHSDASGVFDSDRIRAALRNVASVAERERLLDRWRNEGTIQCFGWIEPLMPAPISKVIWVPGEHVAAAETHLQKARALLDGHLEAAPRSSGSFRDRYFVSDLEHLTTSIKENEPLIVTIDLDYFAGLPAAEQAAAFQRVWNFVIEQRNLRAITFAISRPYLGDDAEANRLFDLALGSALLLPTAQIEFEPFLSVANDRSARAGELKRAGKTLPVYNVADASPELRAKILAEEKRIAVHGDENRWKRLLESWRNRAPQLHLAVKNVQQSTDGVWRIPSDASAEIELITEPWMAKAEAIEWFVQTPQSSRCNVTNLRADQVGFVAGAPGQASWKENQIACSQSVLPLSKIDNLFDRQWHCGSLRLRARARVDGELRETPVLELRRFNGTGFRAAISEQFGLPYVFGSGELSIDGETGPETNLGADCANFIVYAFRRQGLHIPWSDPKQLRKHVDLAAASVSPGAMHFTPEELQRGLIVHLGTHVAAVMEDREPLGVLDDNDLVAHQLKGAPEILTLAELLRDRKKTTFDLLRPGLQPDSKLLFGGDVMLGRGCAAKIDRGLDPFAGIKDLLAQSSFAAANLECTISAAGAPRDRGSYSFRAPNRSAELLRRAGFRAIGLANNHAFDFGADALRDCADKLSREKVEPLGVGRAIDDAYTPKYFLLDGAGKLAVLAITDVGTSAPANASARIAKASERGPLELAIEKARTNANFVVCLVHWGTENIDIVTDKQRELARWLVDHGVDVVVGSHPHCIQPLDFYRGRPIAYSLGNLVFDGAPTVVSWNRGALLQVGLSKTHRISGAKLIPVVLEDGLPKMAPASGVLAKQ